MCVKGNWSGFIKAFRKCCEKITKKLHGFGQNAKSVMSMKCRMESYDNLACGQESSSPFLLTV